MLLALWGTGLYWTKNFFFFGKWPESWSKENITLKEFYPIVAAICVWGQDLANKRILLHTDNQALVHIINSNTTKEVKVMALVRKYW